MENERERLGEWKCCHEPVDFVHIGSVEKRKGDRDKGKARNSVIHYVNVVTCNKKFCATGCFCGTVTLLVVPARAENMDPQCPDEKEEHGHADVELGERNLSSRQEAVWILLLNVDLKSDQFNSVLSFTFTAFLQTPLSRMTYISALSLDQ